VPYVITEVRHRCWPTNGAVNEVLGTLGLSVSRLKEVLSGCSHADAPRSGVGFQLDLGPTMEQHFSTSLETNGLRTASRRYSPNLNENADLAFGYAYDGPRLFLEIEFRPNVEKDLVKFQVGANTGSLAAAVLIVTTDRASVNASYTTMPEFRKVERVIDELQPAYPLLLLGFRGEHR